jgi:chromosome segregation ATPase
MEDNVSLEQHLAILSRYADNVWGKFLEITGFANFKIVEAERDRLKDEVSNLNMKREEAAKEMHTLSQRISELEKSCSEKTSKNKELEAQLLECYKATKGWKTQIKNLNDELANCRLHLALLESEKNASEGKKNTPRQASTYVVASYNKQTE